MNNGSYPSRCCKMLLVIHDRYAIVEPLSGLTFLVAEMRKQRARSRRAFSAKRDNCPILIFTSTSFMID